MLAWETTGDGRRIGLERVEREPPVPAAGEVLVELAACGVCRTDLHVVSGELPVHRPRVVPGHEAVGRVVALGPEVRRFSPGDRAGVPWLRSTCGECRWCRAGRENLCASSTYTGWDADGGYAELLTVPAAFAYRIPDAFDEVTAAPLLCAGIIGYRALVRAAVPPGGRLGIYGFGASAHIAAQIALAQGAEVHVLTRGEGARQFALSLGAASAGDAYAAPPVRLDSAILFAPVGDLVPVALAALDAGGTLSVAGIHLSDVPVLDYQAHLFRERTLTSVTANTRRDGEELFRLAARLGIRPHTTGYSLAAADHALADLDEGRVVGAAVLLP